MNKIKYIVFALFMAPLALFAADAAATVSEAPQWVLDLAAKYPWFVTALLIVGALRLALKPVFSILRLYVESTETDKDNAALDKVEQSKAYKTILYALDWIGSIKLPAKK